jgi:hypothetical protein
MVSQFTVGWVAWSLFLAIYCRIRKGWGFVQEKFSFALAQARRTDRLWKT